MIWIIAIFVPLLGSIITYKLYPHRITWWELFLPIGVSLILTLIFKISVETYQVSDTEYWGGIGISAEYHEKWSTWISQTCTRQVACGTDSKGNTRYCTETYDCSYCDEHPPKWILVNSIGQSFTITKGKWEELKTRWKATPIFIDMKRRIRKSFWCGEDGDVYRINWNNDIYTSEPTTTTHRYENRVQASSSAFNFPRVTEEEIEAWKLYDYPKLRGYSYETVLGKEKFSWFRKSEVDSLEKALQYLNGEMGPRKQLRVWVLLFEKSTEAALLQEALWKGGNKNEVVICVGLSGESRELSWIRVFSWTEKREVIVNLREDLMQMKIFHSEEFVKILSRNLEDFQRKEFKDFSYVSVDPPSWAPWIVLLVSLLSSLGIGIWAVKNDFQDARKSR